MNQRSILYVFAIALLCLVCAVCAFPISQSSSVAPSKALPANILAFIEGFALGIEADGKLLFLL